MNRIELKGVMIPGCTQQIDFSVKRGDVCVLTGNSAETTEMILRSIAGFEQPERGSIYLHEQCVFDRERDIMTPPGERNLRMVFAKQALIPRKSVAYNVASMLEHHSLFRVKKDRRVAWALQFFELDGAANTPVYKLPRWQRFSVQLARVLVSGSDLVIVEDPFYQVDAEDVQGIVQTLRRVSRLPEMTLVVGAFDPTVIGGLANQIVVADSNAFQVGTAAELYQAPACISVAGRIGKPSIDLVEGVAQIQRGYLTVQSALGIWQFPLDDPSVLQWKMGLFPCLVGVRAQDHTFRRQDDAHETSSDEEQLVQVADCLDTYFTTETIRRLDGEGISVSYHSALFVAPGDCVLLRANKYRACIFDRETGRLIKGYSPSGGRCAGGRNIKI